MEQNAEQRYYPLLLPRFIAAGPSDPPSVKITQKERSTDQIRSQGLTKSLFRSEHLPPRKVMTRRAPKLTTWVLRKWYNGNTIRHIIQWCKHLFLSFSSYLMSVTFFQTYFVVLDYVTVNRWPGPCPYRAYSLAGGRNQE